jgi:hypothetical protein
VRFFGIKLAAGSRFKLGSRRRSEWNECQDTACAELAGALRKLKPSRSGAIAAERGQHLHFVIKLLVKIGARAQIM